MTHKLVIFDCDGVLVDSEKLASNTLKLMLADHGILVSNDDLKGRFRGVNLTACLDTLQGESRKVLPDSFEFDLRQRMSAVFRSQLRPIEGALRLIELLTIPFCVASNGPTAKIEENLRTTNLYSHFADKIFSGYEINSWKPDPGLFLCAANHFGVAPEECIVVEDSHAGVSAGIAANMTVLALNAREDNRSFAAATCVFGSLSEIHEFFVSRGLSRE